MELLKIIVSLSLWHHDQLFCVLFSMLLAELFLPTENDTCTARTLYLQLLIGISCLVVRNLHILIAI